MPVMLYNVLKSINVKHEYEKCVKINNDKSKIESKKCTWYWEVSYQ